MSALREREPRRRRGEAHDHTSAHDGSATWSLDARRGKALPPQVRSVFEPAFQHDFRNVRIYDDAKAAELASSSHALAMTRGDEIAFGAGELEPHTPSGQLLLAHELAHVVQQSRGAGGPRDTKLSTDAALEHDADQAALGALVGEPASVQLTAAPAVARAEAVATRCWRTSRRRKKARADCRMRSSGSRDSSVNASRSRARTSSVSTKG